MIIMGLDPGGTTGVAVVDTVQKRVELFQFDSRMTSPVPYGKSGMKSGWKLGEAVSQGIWGGFTLATWEYSRIQDGSAHMYDKELFVAKACVNIMHHAKVEQVVCEDFILRPGGGGGKEGVSPLRIQASIYTASKVFSGATAAVPWAWQSASEGKSIMNDTRLGMVGFGTPHARDAFRHVAHWIRKNKQQIGWVE
jgi:hypothetical protein